MIYKYEFPKDALDQLILSVGVHSYKDTVMHVQKVRI
jgi:hypothetical protein